MMSNYLYQALSKKIQAVKNKDGTEGEHWTVDQTSQYAGNHDKYDFYVVMNMMYSAHCNPKFDEATYAQLTKDWLDDKDIKHKLLDYYYVVCTD